MYMINTTKHTMNTFHSDLQHNIWCHCSAAIFFHFLLAFFEFRDIISYVASDADIAQSVERILGKDEVGGSNPPISFNAEARNIRVLGFSFANFCQLMCSA